jgi:hypothetical protein
MASPWRWLCEFFGRGRKTPTIRVRPSHLSSRMVPALCLWAAVRSGSCSYQLRVASRSKAEELDTGQMFANLEGPSEQRTTGCSEHDLVNKRPTYQLQLALTHCSCDQAP